MRVVVQFEAKIKILRRLPVCVALLSSLIPFVIAGQRTVWASRGVTPIIVANARMPFFPERVRVEDFPINIQSTMPVDYSLPFRIRHGCLHIDFRVETALRSDDPNGITHSGCSAWRLGRIFQWEYGNGGTRKKPDLMGRSLTRVHETQDDYWPWRIEPANFRLNGRYNIGPQFPLRMTLVREIQSASGDPKSDGRESQNESEHSDRFTGGLLPKGFAFLCAAAGLCGGLVTGLILYIGRCI